VVSLVRTDTCTVLRTRDAQNRKGQKRLVGWALYPGRRPRRPCFGLLSCCPFGAPDRRIGGLEEITSRR